MIVDRSAICKVLILSVVGGDTAHGLRALARFRNNWIKSAKTANLARLSENTLFMVEKPALWSPARAAGRTFSTTKGSP